MQLRRLPLLLLLLLLLLLAQTHSSQATPVHVFTNATAPDYLYPEINPDSQFFINKLQQKPSLGIAISGGNGGWRAAALGYGWLRAMHLVSSS